MKMPKSPLVALVAALATAAVLATPSLAADGAVAAPEINAPFPMNPFPAPSQDYAVYLETLLGHGSKVKPAKYCANSSVFQRQQQIVFRMVITNTKTGKVMTGKDLSSVVIKVPGVSPDLKVTFRPQGGSPDATSPWLWSVAWLVPADYPVGTFNFQIVGKEKKTGKQFTLKPQMPGTAWEITP